MFTMIGSCVDLDPKRLDISSAAKTRPFVSPMAWALYSAYHAITASAVLKLHIIKLGIGEKALLNKDAIAKLVKVALPIGKRLLKSQVILSTTFFWMSLKRDSWPSCKIC